MNMSDDVSSATLQVSMKAAEQAIETSGRAVDKTIELIAKLLQSLANKHAENKDKSIKSTDLSDIKSGEVSIKNLVSSARKNGDTLSTSEHGLTQSDKKFIVKKAKEYGLPIAFMNENGKDNIYANVRTNDLSIFQRICTEMMKDKLAERPQQLGNFKVKEWEMPFISNELSKHDLSAQFGKTVNGEHFALYEKKDEKAILIARGEFVRKCNELKDNFSFDKDDNGFYTLKDIYSGREFTFDRVPSKEELSRQIQENFGYDENKARIACAKFGEEQLNGNERQKFFSNNPQNEFSKIDSNIELEGESIYAKEYSCWRLTPRNDEVSKIIFRDNDGSFAVLNPEKMTKKQMSDVLRNSLNITNKNSIDALIDKAEKVSDYYIRENIENFSHSYKFKKSDFDMSNPETTSQMLRVDENGNTFTKSVPINDIYNDIERTGKDSFTVISTAQTIESDKDGTEY